MCKCVCTMNCNIHVLGPSVSAAVLVDIPCVYTFCYESTTVLLLLLHGLVQRDPNSSNMHDSLCSNIDR